MSRGKVEENPEEGSMPAELPEVCDELFARHLNAGEIEETLALYEATASHVREDGTLARGVEEIREVLEAFVAMEPSLDVTVTKVVPICDDLAALYDEWHLTAKTPDGDRAEMDGEGLHVVRRGGDGSWRFAATGLLNRG